MRNQPLNFKAAVELPILKLRLLNFRWSFYFILLLVASLLFRRFFHDITHATFQCFIRTAHLCTFLVYWIFTLRRLKDTIKVYSLRYMTDPVCYWWVWVCSSSLLLVGLGSSSSLLLMGVGSSSSLLLMGLGSCYWWVWVPALVCYWWIWWSHWISISSCHFFKILNKLLNFTDLCYFFFKILTRLGHPIYYSNFQK